MEMVHDRCSTLLTEFGTALTTILPILFQYCYKYCHSDSRLVLQCIKGVSSNPVEGRTKICQLKDLILSLFGLIVRRIYIYIYIYVYI